MATKKYPNDASGKLLDTISKEHECRNESAISQVTGISADRLSKIRHGKMAVSAEVILSLHENPAINKTVAQIRKLIGS